MLILLHNSGLSLKVNIALHTIKLKRKITIVISNDAEKLFDEI
jgi:hypothetical protein